MWILIVISVIATIIGYIMVNRVGNYETFWGAMLFGGFAVTVISILIKMAIFVVLL